MAREGGRSGRGGGLSAAGGDFFQLVVDYAKQETLGPLKSLGRFVAFGVAGSIALTVGAVLLLLAAAAGAADRDRVHVHGPPQLAALPDHRGGGPGGHGPGGMADQQGAGGQDGPRQGREALTMATTARITRDDLEAKLREMSGGVEETVEAVRPKLISAAAAGVVLVVLIAYLLGRRRGRARSAVVEIRKV